MIKRIYESPMFEFSEVELEDCLAISKVAGEPVGKAPETPVHEEVEDGDDGFFNGW